MTCTVDTNVLVRLVMADDERQGRAAAELFSEAVRVVVTLPALCEMVWVLRSIYKLDRAEIAEGIEAVISLQNVQVERPAVEAGLSLLASGGDFADGVIAQRGAELGGRVFASFDKKAIMLLEKDGKDVHLLA